MIPVPGPVKPLREKAYTTAVKAADASRKVGEVLGLSQALPSQARTLGWKVRNRLETRRQIADRVDSDTYLLADVPRCGIGWMRHMVATALHWIATGHKRKFDFLEMYRYVPTMHGQEDLYQPYRHQDRWAYLKTHSRYFPAFERGLVQYRDSYRSLRSQMAMNLMSEGRDALGKAEDPDYQTDFLVDQARRHLSFYESWLEPLQEHPERFMAIRYDELVDQTEPLIRKVFPFISIDPSDLPDGAITEIAGMYTKEDTGQPEMAGATDEEAWEVKYDLLEKAEEFINRKELERRDPELAGRLAELHDAFDNLRTRP